MWNFVKANNVAVCIVVFWLFTNKFTKPIGRFVAWIRSLGHRGAVTRIKREVNCLNAVWSEILKISLADDVQPNEKEVELQTKIDKNIAANMWLALKRMPVASVTIWMDNLVAVFWISNPGKPWKEFVANRVKKIPSITAEFGIKWKTAPRKQIPLI